MKNVALALAVLLSVLGFWLGEGGSPPWSVLPIAGGFVGCLIVALVAPGKLSKKAAVGIGCLVLYSFTYFAGLRSFDHAFNDCVERGEEVRGLLREYYGKKSQYPERLNELEAPLPCGRITRPTLLEYERREGGYILTLQDWLVQHTATESDPFMAKK